MPERTSGPSPTPVFFHLPKTGGRTLLAVFRRQYGRDRIFEAYSPTSDEALDRFKGLSEDDKRAYDAVVGHVPIDIHELIPGPCVYVTLVRNPIERPLSDYHYVRRNVSSERPRAEDLPQHTLDLLRELNEVDMELYRRVKDRFREKVRSAEHVLFGTKRSAFGSLNRAYGRCRGLGSRMRQALSDVGGGPASR